MKAHHLAVRVLDLERSLRFYRDTLGLAVIKRWDEPDGQARSYWLQLEQGAFLAVEHAAKSKPTRLDESPGWHCVALGIERTEREVWRARLARAGFPVCRETAYTIYARDPDGNLVGLSHYPEPAPRDS